MTERKDFATILDTMNQLSIKKDKDYAGDEFLSNFRVAKMLGVKPSMGAAIRLSDKWSRICQLVQKPNPEVIDETIEDTLMDMANYCIIMILLLREENGETSKKTTGWSDDGQGPVKL